MMLAENERATDIDLSIIIPAFNEEARIGETLDRLHLYLVGKAINWEIIVVDDGSSDGTAALIKSRCQLIKGLMLHQQERNEGKGAAVKAGMLKARGSTRIYMDADNSTDVVHCGQALQAIDDGADIVIGSRRIDGAKVLVRQPLVRRLAGAAFSWLVGLLFKLEIKDSQNGFKAFTAAAAERTFGPLMTRGWAFDVEILVRASRSGLIVREIPIKWINDERSSLRLRHVGTIALDLFKTRMKLRGPLVESCQSTRKKEYKSRRESCST